MRAMGKTGVLSEQPVLSIIPSGQPNAAAEPVIGKIELIIR
jgi:hypothetical protein